MNTIISKEDLLTEIEAELNALDLVVTGKENALVVADAFQRLFEVIKDEPECIVRCNECVFAQLTVTGECKYCERWEEMYNSGESVYLPRGFYCGFGLRGVKDYAAD